jgi:3-phenylpropionate/trans-cinnamate dioxygenase ferredoxin subunit
MGGPQRGARLNDDGFVAIAAADAIAAGGSAAVAVGELSILIVNLGGAFHALENRCSHAASPLAGGRIKMGRISCPLHGAIFDLRTGAPLSAAIAPQAVRVFDARVVDGRIEVRLPPKGPA